MRPNEKCHQLTSLRQPVSITRTMILFLGTDPTWQAEKLVSSVIIHLQLLQTVPPSPLQFYDPIETAITKFFKRVLPALASLGYLAESIFGRKFTRKWINISGERVIRMENSTNLFEKRATHDRRTYTKNGTQWYGETAKGICDLHDTCNLSFDLKERHGMKILSQATCNLIFARVEQRKVPVLWR